MDLVENYLKLRQETVKLCSPLATEDYVVQPTREVSPPKWHLGHTTWFFEKVILEKFVAEYSCFNGKFDVLFNSYYKGMGDHWLQDDRGTLSRPTVDEVLAYRQYVDKNLVSFLQTQASISPELNELINIGLHHEQQHQELLLMDIKSILFGGVVWPAYAERVGEGSNVEQDKDISNWMLIEEQIIEAGYEGEGFAYDNEYPRHRRLIYDGKIATHLVTNSEFAAFISDGGYQRPELWLSKGWDWISRNQVDRPMYWLKQGENYQEFTLYGLEDLKPDLPVTHVSYFEADAFARWRGMRLPTEFEMEHFLERSGSDQGRRQDSCHPTTCHAAQNQLWVWTSQELCLNTMASLCATSSSSKGAPLLPPPDTTVTPTATTTNPTKDGCSQASA